MPVRFAVSRPVATLMLYAGLLFFGLIASFSLPVDFLPEISVPTLVVSASYPGASAEEMRRLVAIPLEDAFASMKGISSLRSVSRRGLATLTLDFQWGTNMTLSGVQAREIIDGVYPLLPQAAERPRVLPLDPNAKPVIILGVASRDESLQTARTLADREIKTALQQVEGVGAVVLVGGSEREVHLEVDESRLLAAGLSIDEVASFLAAANLDLPAGTFTDGETEYLVRTDGRVGTPQALAALEIPTPSGYLLRISDLARAAWRPKEQLSLFLVNGRESVGLLVRARSGESPVRLSQRLRTEIARLSSAYAGSLEITVVEDGATPILESIHALVTAALLGAGAAFLVMVLFLRRMRPALILITSVPASVLFCLLLLWITGRTVNVMSLGGIALSVGMLVDDSVVVLESLERRLASVSAGSLRDGIISATCEVSSSIVGSTFTTVVVFVPVLFLPGLIGALYTDLALAVLYSLFASLVVSATLVPVLFLITYPAHSNWPGEHALRAGSIERGYRRTLARALRHPLVVAAVLLAVTALTVPLLFATRLELVAPFDSGTIEVRLAAAPATSMEHLARIAHAASNRLLALPRVVSVWCRAGGEESDTPYFADAAATRETVTMWVRTSYGRKPDSIPIVNTARRALAMEGADLSVSLPQSSLAQLLGLRALGRELSTLAPTPEQAGDRARRVASALKFAAPSAVIRVEEAASVSELHCTPDREALARAGITLGAVAQVLWQDLEGAVPTRLSMSGRDYDVRVLLAEPERGTRKGLSRLRLKTASGSLVEVEGVTHIAAVQSPSTLVRENRQDVARVRMDEEADPSGRLAQAIAKAAREQGVADTARTVFARHAPEIGVVLAVALLLLYVLLGAQFESFIQPLIILVAVPLAAAGLLAALLGTGRSLNLSSGLAVLVLLGTVVKVSIILFANYRRRIDGGAPPSFAIYTGTSERLRPILISTVATICALLPIAVNWNGLSSEDGIATAVIGGLILSTALTLYVVPLLTWGYYRSRERDRKAGRTSDSRWPRRATYSTSPPAVWASTTEATARRTRRRRSR